MVEADGGFEIHSCNNVIGAIIPDAEIATFTSETATWHNCPGVEGDIDRMLAAAVQGQVAWEVDGRLLELRPLNSALRLHFRVKTSPSRQHPPPRWPPWSAAE